MIVEVCQLLASRRGAAAEAAFLTTLGSGALQVIDLEPADYTKAAALVEQYADLPLGAVDATVIAVAERLASPRSPPSTGATSPSSAQPTSTRSPCCPPSFLAASGRSRRHPDRSRRSLADSPG